MSNEITLVISHLRLGIPWSLVDWKLVIPTVQMPEIAFPYHAVLRTLDNGLVLAEGLLFPEVSRLARTAERGRERLSGNVSAMVTKLPLADLHRRGAAENVELRTVMLS